MRTRSQSCHNSPQQEASPVIVEPLRIELPFLEDQFQEDPPPKVPMDDNQTMAELLQAPTEGFIELCCGWKFLGQNAPRMLENNLEQVQSSSITSQGSRCQAPVSSSTPAPVKAVEPNCVTCDGSGTLLSNTITNPKEELKGITTQSGVAYQGPTNSTPSKQGTEVTKDQVQTPSSLSTAPVQPPVIQPESQTPISEPVVAPVNMSFEISFTDALILMPKFASTLKALIGKKEKLSEMSRTLINEHCSAVILNKLPRNLGDPEKFLIPCEFPGMDECLALADLGASINLMPLSVWEALSLLELTL
nr:reverse transcriptase domain-containing protein [Tanacetum cinerariifolium]GFA49503.1 reverse transcriptase domain-containing protein [Tanacetum cinerariifolium]